MQIDKQNYQEYFLLYVDNELPQQECEIVEAFVNQNPALRAELDLLLQTITHLDDGVVFAGKRKLLKNETISEEELITFLDGEATTEKAAIIEKLRMENEAVRWNIDELEKLYLKADENIVYTNKHTLLHKATIRKIDWWKITVAASLLLLIGTWVFLNKQDEEEDIVQFAVADTLLQHGAKPDDTAVEESKIASAAKIDILKQNSDENQKNEPELVIKNKNLLNKERVKKTAHSIALSEINKSQTVTRIEEMPLAVLGNIPIPPVEFVTTKQEKNITQTAHEPNKQMAFAGVSEKEKKGSIFKKIGKQIGDRALDVLTDGGEEINIAGFAIEVRK